MLKSVSAAGWRHAMSCAFALMLAAIVVAMTGGAALAATFVDASLPDVAAEKRVVIAKPQPVQLLFQFQTKGAPNAQATKFVKQTVVDAVKASGLFSDVSEGPAPNGAVLNVVIDNVVEPGDMSAAAGKGVVTGATLFIAGSTIQEHYKATVEYVGGPTALKISRTAQHSIYSQMGLINSPPPNGVKAEGGIKGAVFTMARQIVSNPLNDLASDPGFALSSTPEAAASTPPVSPTPDAATPATPAESAPSAAPPLTPATPATPVATQPAASPS